MPSADEHARCIKRVRPTLQQNNPPSFLIILAKMSKPTLYTFGMSVWASVPDLALIELGYTDQHIQKKTLNLVEGDNFKPSFLEINPNGTIPTLEADGVVYTSTADVTHYLVQNASLKVAPATPTLIAKIHDDQYDPNFASMLARNEEELKAKGSGFMPVFLQNRQDALATFSATPEGAPFKPFYDTKLAANGGLLAIYSGTVPADVQAGFFTQSQKHWDNLRSFILVTLPATLPNSTPFLGGVRPGENDFHLGAWLARVASVGGGQYGRDGVKGLEKELGEPVPEKIVRYWNAWSERDSWQKVYANGLH